MFRMWRVNPVLLSGAWLVLSSTAAAIPQLKAVLDISHELGYLKGDWEIDLGGGPVRGSASLKGIPYPADAPLRTAEGLAVGGKLSATLVFTGNYTGGVLGLAQGTVQLEGTVTRGDNGQTGRVQGVGEWTGHVDAVLGRLNVECYWPALDYEGQDIARTASLAFTLPPARFEPLSTFGAPPALPNPRMGSGNTGWWIGSAVVLALVVGGIVAAKRGCFRRRTTSPPRRTPPPLRKPTSLS